jgi:hypothetical protein
VMVRMMNKSNVQRRVTSRQDGGRSLAHSMLARTDALASEMDDA